jgi:outer membrane protein assembly factor BamD
MTYFRGPIEMRSSLTTYFFATTLAFLLAFTSCSEFNKVVKSTDIEYKYSMAVKYYDNKEYFKALPILEELIGLTRGTQRAEDVYYYYAKSHYGVKDYYLGNYYLKSFTKTFSNSARSEECLFLAAQCSYQLSPSYSLDQTDTNNAIDEFQLFLDAYPNSNLRDSANHQVERLLMKLERKAYENAKIYAKTQRFKAASSALKDFLKDYPVSQYREEILYLIVMSNYLYAEGSVEEKKLERMRTTSESYLTFATAFPQSKWLREAEGYYRKSERQIERLTSK